MWEKYFGIFMTFNIYVFKVILNFKNLKISNCTKNPKLFLWCTMVRKVLNPYIIHFERYKKEKPEKVKRV
jgi:hypothetical protein